VPTVKTFYRVPTRREKPRRKRPELFFQPLSEAVTVMPDGREICNHKNAEGKKEYKNRIIAMWLRQIRLCCNCQQELRMREATFEHENGRGAAKQDDRIEIDGTPINGASHGTCNAERGSKRTPIWHGPQEKTL